jgi:hypothetical protein
MVQRNSSVVGIWKLISVTEADDSTISYPFGQEVGGLLMIDPSGYYSAQLMNMKRPSFKSPDPRAGTSEEIKMAFEDYLGYYGTYDLDEIKKVITWHVKGSLWPNLIGRDQLRYYELNGNRMILRAPVFFSGKDRVINLVWERVK